MHDDGQGRHVGDGEPSRRRGRPALLPVLAIVLAAALGVATALAVQRPASGPARAGPGSRGAVHDGTGHAGAGHDGAGHDGAGRNGTGPSGPGGTAGGRMNDQAVYDRLLPSIVDVTSTLRYAGETASGSGFIISGAEALVLTNNHVVKGATAVTATLARTGRTYTARIVGVDVVHDVALLQLQGPGGLTAAPVGNSALLALGTPVLAIGNQAGQGGSPEIAPGVITDLNRTIQAAEASSGFTETLHNMLQTNARIAPGDSGGPLANSAGQVVGMDTAAGTGGAPGAAAGYAIPINAALSIARLIAAGDTRGGIIIGVPGFLGVLLPASSNPDPRHQAAQEQVSQTSGGIPAGRPGCLGTDKDPGAPVTIAPSHSGALVDGVLCGSAAAAAGIVAGDVITRLGGRAVTSPAALTGLLNAYQPGAAVAVVWMGAGGARHTARIRLETAPAR